MTYEEYLQYEETVLPELLRKYANFAPDIFYPQFVSSFEDAYAAEHSQTNNTENNEQQGNDTTTEEPATTPGDTVLQTEETNNSRGDSQSKEQPTEVPTGVRSSNENGTLPQSTPTEVASGTDYILSNKEAENGENFYQDANGNIDLVNIPEEVFDKIDRPKAPLRLTPSMLKHVFDRHGKEMGLSRIDDAIDFILDVMDNFDHVRQGDKNAVIFSIENGRSRTGRRAVTVLLNSESGEYYGIKTSGYERIEGLNKKPLLWEKGAKDTSTTGVAPANVSTEQASQSNEPAGSASNHNNDFEGKVTQSSQTKETKEDKFSPTPRKDGESITDYAERVAEEHQAQRTRKEEEAKVDTNPTDAQKEAGNYKKGHIKVDGLNITIEQPKGSIRRGTDANGKQWESEMHNTYGYIRGTESVDGDHIDIFLSDNPTEGNVFVVDQVNKDGSFDEHKVMYGFPDMESAKQAYLSNYEEGWQGLGSITEVKKEDFKKWIDSSKRKTKPFAKYSTVKTQGDVQTKKPTEAELRERKKQELRNKLKAKLRGQLNVGVDPELFMMGVELASMEIEDGVRKFADFTKKMIAEIGDEIRPYLKSIYNGARDLPGMEEFSKEMTPYEEVKAFNIATIGDKGEKVKPSVLDTAEQKLEEYTEAMREELEEKEKKYAAMDSEIKTATNIIGAEEAEDEDSTESKDTKDDILYRTVFGGNSGYVGYSMSKRAAEAKEEGRYPKTEFRREYHITEKSLDMLTRLGFIDNSEWHHTSMYGNKTPFYGWAEDEFADDYLKHKKEVDTLCKGIDPKTKQSLLEKVEKPQYEHEYEMPQYGEAETAANPIREWRHKQIEKYDQFTGFKGYADATEEEKKERDAYLHSLNEQMDEKIREMLAKDYPDYLAAKNALDAYNNYEEDLRKTIGERIKEYLDIDKYSQRWREQTATAQPTANTETLTNHAESVVQNLHLNNVEIVPDGSSLNDEQATAKGFYNKRTGKIVVVASNHTNIADIEKTVLHEAVAHHGLRQLFGDNFDNFLDTVFAKADIETRQQIAHLSAKHGWNIRTATEEYLASMAEDTNFEQIKPTLWQRIKQLFGEIMSAFGLHHANITDNDLRYILWRSYKNLQGGGKHSILDKAEDIAMQYRLKASNYTDKFTDKLNAVNERFNEELSNLTEENADKVTLWLGKPSKVLLAAGVEDKPMKLYGNKVIRKMKKHGFSLEELRDLPRAVADPVAVFNNYQREGNRSILTELKTQQGNFLVSVNIGKDADINFNIVRSVFGKGNENVVAWINNGLATYINKEKALSFLSHQSAPIAATAANAGQESSSYLHLSAPIAEAAENSELSSAAKIIKDFHNPKLNSNVLYRSSIDPTTTEVLPDARTRYEEETKEPDNIGSVPKTHNFFRRFYKSYVDSMLALKSFTNSVLEATGDKMASHEDTYKAENAMTSKNKTDGEVYNPLFPYMPLYLYM